MDGEPDALATRLRVDTQSLHVQAERSGYIQEILKRRANRKGYAMFLRNLLPAYQALEQALSDHADRPELRLFDWPPLYRGEAISSDLQALSRADKLDDLPLLAEGRAYAARIEHIQATDPVRLIGHAYVRYVGDLSGGQIVKALLTTSPGLTPDMLGFYDFPDIPDAPAYKDAFRAALDQIGDLVSDVDPIVDEAKAAFKLNIDLSLGVMGAGT